MKPVADLLRAANPVPNPDAALTEPISAAISVDIAQRVGDPDRRRGINPQRAAGADRPIISEIPHASNRRPKALLAVSCLLVLGAAVGFAILANRPPNTEAATSRPVNLAEEYIAARNAWKTDEALALLAPEAVVTEFPVIRSRDEFPALIAYLELTEETLAVTACDPIPGQPKTVTCYYEINNIFTERYLGPAVSGTLQIESDEEQIISLINSPDPDPPLKPFMLSWFSWLDAIPSFGSDSLYRWAIHHDTVLPSPRLEELDQLEIHLSEYLAANP